MPKGQEHLWDGKKEFHLGRSLSEATAEWAKRVHRIEHDATVDALLTRYKLDVIPKKAAATRFPEFKRRRYVTPVEMPRLAAAIDGDMNEFAAHAIWLLLLTGIYLDAMWRRVRKETGLHDLRIHDLRRTVGSWLVKDGASLHLVGAVLNHKDQKTTAGYAYFQTQDRQKALDKHGKKVIELATKHRTEFRSNADFDPPGTEDTKMHTGRFAREELYDMARSVNAVMTTTYWHVGRRLVEQEQQGAARAGYGEQLLKRLSLDLSKRFGRGFSERNLEQMRAFYLGWPISQAASAKTLPSPNAERRSHISRTVSAKLTGEPSWPAHSPFPLPWSHYARLLAVRNSLARAFYEREAFCGVDRYVSAATFFLRRIETLQEGAPERGRPPIRDFEVQWPASSTAVRRRNR